MSNHASESSLPVLSHADGFAASASDALLLVGRVLLGWLFLTSAWGKFMNMGGYVAYLGNRDALLLVGRVLLGWLFLTSAWGKFMNMGGYVAYLTNLKVPNPGFFSWIGAPVEFLIGVTLILGFATRYAALVCLLFLIVATALAHRYWEYPAAQVMAQYNNFLKNLALFGGTLVLFVTGAGRFSADRMLSKKD